MSTIASPLSVAGSRSSGAPVRTQNVMAACSIANIVKSSLGPVGLDKMLVDDIGDVTVTNDGATILRLLEVEHPAARVLVELAQLQDDEVGDGTTSVEKPPPVHPTEILTSISPSSAVELQHDKRVIVAAELLKNADDLVKQKIHPTSIISGYRIACRDIHQHISSVVAGWLAGEVHYRFRDIYFNHHWLQDGLQGCFCGWINILALAFCAAFGHGIYLWGGRITLSKDDGGGRLRTGLYSKGCLTTALEVVLSHSRRDVTGLIELE
uniref:(California timema) hypothetical protein n=1 Tax=Timema californicum TaxID=61474 RepID=A0A7R9P3Z7_TIMCA|nr:unnamed protein product [Timema californicum]